MKDLTPIHNNNSKLGTKEKFLNLLKDIYKSHKANIIHNGKAEVLKALPLMALTSNIEFLTSTSDKIKERKGIRLVKKEMRLMVFTDDITVCTENTEESTSLLLE